MTLTDNILLVLLAGFLVLLNGFFVLVEFALVKVRRSRLEELNKSGHKKAELALSLHKKMDAYLSATQLGITVASLGLGWIGEPAFARLTEPVFAYFGVGEGPVLHSFSFAFAFLLITFLHLIIGELAPKTIAIQKAEGALLKTAFPMRIFYLLFYLPLHTLNGVSNFIIRAIGLSKITDLEGAISEEELRIILSHAQKTGKIPLNRLLLFENTLDFKKVTVSKVMIPLSKAIMLDLRRSWPENLAQIRSHRFSRYPLVDGEVSPGRANIVGMVHIKDVMFSSATENPSVEPDLKAFKREMMRVDEDGMVETLLRDFQRKHKHIAVVVDKSSVPVGIVTMEDILEEMVGEIVDEFEHDPICMLSEFIPKEAILLDMDVSDKEAEIKALVDALVPHIKEPEPLDAWKVYEAVMAREKEVSTYIGCGITVPHAKIDGISRPWMAIGRAVREVAPAACDEPTAVISFLILVPKNLPHMQLRVLRRIAGIAQSGYFLSALQDAKTPEKVHELLKTADVSITIDQ